MDTNENCYFFADSNGNPADQIGSLRWAGPYCFQCDISLVTGESGGYNVTKNPLLFLTFQYDACPDCGRDANSGPIDTQTRWGPTEQELAERKRYQGPVWYATAFTCALPPEKIKKLQKETQVIDSLGNLMTADFFLKKILKEVKYHFYNPKK